MLKKTLAEAADRLPYIKMLGERGK